MKATKRRKAGGYQYNYLHPPFSQSRFISIKCNVMSTSFVILQFLTYLLLQILYQTHMTTNVACQSQHSRQSTSKLEFVYENISQDHTNVRTKRWSEFSQVANDKARKLQNSTTSTSKENRPLKRHQSWHHHQSSQRLIANHDSQTFQIGRVVVYQVRFIATKTGRTDYALVGESIELSCHYIMKDEDEDVKQLIWSKDGENFLRWRKNKPGLDVLSYTFKGHIDGTSTRSHIIIHNTTIEMHGQYKCSMKTDLGQHEAEQDVVVISQGGCRPSDWRIVSQPGECREMFRFDCKNMFPKPVPSCGLWNAKLEKFIRSVPVDISEEPNRLTYRVRYSDRFELKQSPLGGASGDKIIIHKSNASTAASDNVNNNNNKTNRNLNLDLLQYAGHLVFKCDIIVPETSWKVSMTHKMFDFNDGCLQDPLETIDRMRSNYSHYAAARMQKAGFHIDKPLDDFEMLSSSLKYELLPPFPPPAVPHLQLLTKNINQRHQQVELNCWQKPRFGTLARLSCAGNWVPISEAQLDQNRNKLNIYQQQHQPLTRLNKRREPISKSTLSTTANDDLRKQKQQQEQQPETIINSSILTSTNLTLNQLNHQSETSSSSSPTANKDDDYVAISDYNLSNSDSNDLEESSIKQTTTTTAQQLSETDTIPTTEINLDSPTTGSVGPPLTPSQLAHLLPTCVSTRAHPSARLPVRILESLQNRQQHPHHEHPTSNVLPGQSQDSLFSFSSAASSTLLPGHIGHSMLLFALLLLTSIRLSILNDQLSWRRFNMGCT